MLIVWGYFARTLGLLDCELQDYLAHVLIHA
jgi:hypothetical protein